MSETKKEKFGITGIIILFLILIGSSIFIYMQKDEHLSKATKVVTNLSNGEIITDYQISLNKYASNITLKKGGEYTISGSFNYSVIIDSTAEITINLDNVKITSSNSAGILCKNAKKLTINTLENTENTITDKGTSSYDASIYSVAPIIFDGKGKLTINGNQTNGEGITTKSSDITINNGTLVIKSNDNGIDASTDGGNIMINGGILYIDALSSSIKSNKTMEINDGTIFLNSGENKKTIDTILGYKINGGTIIALGNEKTSLPLEESSSYSMSFEFSKEIEANSIMSLQTNSKNEIISFKNPKTFKYLFISTKNINKGKYKLFTSGTDVADIIYGIYQSKKYENGKLLGTFKVENNIGNYEVKNEEI